MSVRKNTRKLVALDFASTGLKVVAAEVLDNGLLRILSDEFHKADAIKHGIIGYPTGTAFNVTTVMKRLMNSAKLSHDPVSRFSIAVGGKSMTIVPANIKKTFRGKQEITAKLLEELSQEVWSSYNTDGKLVYADIPVSYEVNGRKIEDPEGMTANDIFINYHLVVADARIHENFQKCMERISEYKTKDLFLLPDAIAFAVSEEEEREEGCAFINMGDTTTTLAIYKGDLIQYLLTIPFGGGNITKDIEEIGIAYEHAEKLKQRFGVASQALLDEDIQITVPALDASVDKIPIKRSMLAMIIEARLDEIFYPIKQALARYTDEIPYGIILSGGAAKMEGMSYYIANYLDMEVRIGEHHDKLSDDTPSKYHDSKFSQLVGILFMASNREDDEISQVEEEPQKPKKPKKSRKSISNKLTQSFFEFFSDGEDPQQEARQKTQQ